MTTSRSLCALQKKPPGKIEQVVLGVIVFLIGAFFVWMFFQLFR